MKPFAVRAIAIASLGGVLFGYDLGVVSGALPPLAAEFSLSNAAVENFVSVLYWGGGIGAAVGGAMCDAWGRRTAVLITDVAFLIGACVLRYSQSYEAVLAGRFVLGWAVAVSGVADTAYLTEIAPVSSRGSIVSVNEACISLGFLAAYGAAFAIGDDWRLTFGGSGVVALLQFVGMLFMPESPVWLHRKGRVEEARAVRVNIEGTTDDETEDGAGGEDEDGRRSSGSSPQHFPNYGNCTADDSFEAPPSVERVPACEEPTPAAAAVNLANLDPQRKRRYLTSCLHFSHPLRAFRRIRRCLRVFIDEVLYPYRRQCAVSAFLAAAQQFCGHVNVLNFAPVIFAQLHETNRNRAGAGHTEEGLTPEAMTVLIGVAKFITTLLVIWKVERLGRRTLLLSGMSCIAASLLLLWISFATDPGEGGAAVDVVDGEESSLSTGADTGAVSAVVMNRLAVAGVYGVAIGYAASFGPLTWLLTSELFPADVRGRALGSATIVTYLSAGIVSRTFLSTQETYGRAAPFAVYFFVTLVSLVFAAVAIPDTGEKTVGEINDDMGEMWFWRGRRRKGSEGGTWNVTDTNVSSTSPDASSSDDTYSSAIHTTTTPSTTMKRNSSFSSSGIKSRRSAHSLPPGLGVSELELT